MLDKAYDPKKYEGKIAEIWEKLGTFKPENCADNGTHANILPPPNANGKLHLGHASGYTIMDIAGRFARMNGKKTLLLPGKDHAGIMTQVIYEKLLASKGIDKDKLSRKELFDGCFDFCMKNAEKMRSQEKRIGISADWEREKFTLDPTISQEVLDTFIKMYEDGIAYKGDRIINWCPHCQTAVSDIEVNHKESKGKIRELHYPLSDGSGKITVATTRPETMLGDTAVAVHPEDSRYKDLIGKTILLPIVERPIPIVADEEIDKDFGSGAVKITPSHDPLDWKIGKKNNLPEISVIGKNGKIVKNDDFLEFEGLSTKQACDLVVEKFEKLGLLGEVKNHTKPLSTHDRCGNTIEPLTSMQWWINVDHEKFSLKKEAIKAVKDGKIQIVPKNFEKTFFHWMENLQDWCISRQLWWGHQIPAWYKDGEMKVQKDSPGEGWVQDPDTFDTWFSSGQWAYSTVLPFGEKEFFPGDFMVMGRDILFFWACRMIMMSLYSTGKAPFETLYLTGLIQDKDGKKMSKSKGNGIDPLEMADKYGTDALRLSLFIGNAPGTDMRLWEEKIETYRNFVNKIWNASRFVQMQLKSKKDSEYKSTKEESQNFGTFKPLNFSTLTEVDKWILTSLQDLIKGVTKDIENYQYSQAGQKLYDFTWNEFCDWYLELSKGENQNFPVLTNVLSTLLKLLHPFIPFVTEAIYSELFANEKTVAQMDWPEVNKDFVFRESLENTEKIISVIKAIRELRREMGIEPAKKIKVKIKTSESFISESSSDIERIAKVDGLEVGENLEKSDGDLFSVVGSKIEVILPTEGNLDPEKEKKRKEKESKEIESQIKNLEGRLANKSYTEKAPGHLVEATKKELEETKAKLKLLS